MKDSIRAIKPAALICMIWLLLLPDAVSVSMTEGSTAVRCEDAWPPIEDTLPRIRNHPMVAGCESVFMVTDRETYIAGENVWFSMTTLITGKRHIPRSLAGYAEVMNASGVPVSQSRILLDGEGTGAGLLPLPDSLSSGEYLLRGYTRSMISYGPEHFFTRVIRIFNPYNMNPLFTTVIPDHCPAGPAVELFPEGGYQSGGRPTAVAVKTTGQGGTGVAARVILSYNNGTTLSDTVTTGINGTAVAIIPQEAAGVRAFAIIDSSFIRCDLPGYPALPHSLSVTGVHGEGTRITVSHAPYRQRMTGEYLWLAVISRQGVTFLRRFSPGTEDDIFSISGSDLAPGINECLLIDNAGTLLASRLFMNSSPAEEVKIETGNGTIRIVLPHDSLTVTATAAISGANLNNYPCNVALLSEWLSASAMADPFMRPFISGAEKITDELLLMLRDRYLDVETGRLKEIIAETRGLAVDCEVTNLTSMAPAEGKMLFINLPGKTCFLHYAVTSPEGRLTFIVPPRKGTGEIVVYPQDSTENLVIRISSPFFSGSIPLRIIHDDVNKIADTETLRMSINSQVMRIFGIRETDTVAVVPDTAAAHFYGTPGQRLVLSDYIALPEIGEFFFELIPDWNLVKTRTSYEFRLYDPVTALEIKAKPLMMIDGTCTTDPGTIAGLSPYITEYIDVCPGNFRLGSVNLPPIVSLITKKGDYRMQSLPPQALRIKYPFSTEALVFRPFRGDDPGHMPRFGNTLLWAPAVNTGRNRELLFTLTNPDYKMPLIISVAVKGRDGLTRSYTRIIESGSL